MDIEGLRQAVEPGYESREAALMLLKHGQEKGRKSSKIRNQPCGDCAVTCGLYTGLAACAYRFLTPEEKVEIINNWDCHNGGRCEGAALVIGE